MKVALAMYTSKNTLGFSLGVPAFRLFYIFMFLGSQYAKDIYTSVRRAIDTSVGFKIVIQT